MQCWVNGPATDGIGDKINPPAADQRSNIPTFHFRGEFESQKIYILSVGCRNSETFNYEMLKLVLNCQYAKTTKNIYRRSLNYA